MIEIRDLLGGWENKLLKEEVKKQSIKKAILVGAGIEVDSGDIKIKNNTVILSIKPIYKNEIFLKQEKIISELEKLLGARAPTHVR